MESSETFGVPSHSEDLTSMYLPKCELYDDALKRQKKEQVLKIVESKIASVVSSINKEEPTFKKAIVKFAMATVEHLITHKKSGASKREIVINALLPYFKDPESIGIYIDLLLPEISKSTKLTRTVDSIYRGFLKLVKH